MSDALEALRNVDFDWVRSLDSVWSDSQALTGAPNEALAQSVAARFFEETRRDIAHPRGDVLVGQSGIGKTHLVSLLRNEVWKAGGWFVLLDVLGLTDFWRSAALSFLTSLLQEMPDGRRQFEAVLAGVARRFKVDQQVDIAFKTPGVEPRQIVNLLVKGLMKTDMQNTLRHQDVFRALCFLRSSDLDTISLAHSWLQGYDADEKARAEQGFVAPPPPPVELVRGMCWIMSLAGPTLVAVDQIDGVVNPSSLAVQGTDDIGAVQGLGEVLAAGLLELHDVRRRGKTVITCLFDTWNVLEERSLLPFRQRLYVDPIVMVGMNKAESVRALIINRLAPAFQANSFKPPYPSWPFSEAAIASAASVAMMPRTVLMRCDAFRRACLDKGKVEICDSLIEASVHGPKVIAPRALDADLTHFCETADVTGLIAADDDIRFGHLLRDMLDLYVRQIEPTEAVDVVSKGHPAQKIPPLHGRLTFIFHDQNDRERHFCFRVLQHTHATSFQARLRAALTASGVSSQIPDRHLVIVRRDPVPSGPKSRQLFDVFRKAGGVLINVSDDDLRTFVALRMLRDQVAENGRQDEFESWLRSQKPLLATDFFNQAGLNPPPETLTPAPAAAQPKASVRPKPDMRKPAAPPVSPTAASIPTELPATGPEVPLAQTASKSRPEAEAPPPLASAPSTADAIPVGRRMSVGEEPVSVPTKLLQRHVAIIAGSGSGKTVLLRRIVEEAALAGISAIVIDPNNDLSRLGDPWPQRPSSFTGEDDIKAQRFFKTVEVVVWTPGIYAGRPLFLPVMPDFAGLGDDKDERQQAVDMAAETLAPLAGAKNQLQRGVLVEALRHFANSGGGEVARFMALLADLPDGLSPIGKADKLAAGMADQLHAAVATNPLLRTDGPLLDPKLLFFGNSDRVRISVVNLSGLTSDAAKEDFINRLQMTLFSWIKKHPSPTGLLYVIDEAQTFLPSQKPVLSLGSGVKLVAQARKYGLGMIVVTQAPRGIHNQVVSNCTTQFFGRQNAPATIGAAQEIIAASGGRADDIGKLKTGEFYFATEGSGKPGKVRTPICLSYHPPNPPTPDEVIARAKR